MDDVVLNHWSELVDDLGAEFRGQICYSLEYFEQFMTPEELAAWKKPPDPDLVASMRESIRALE